MDHDIVIVGAGPAGLSTALHLLKLAPDLARRTLILERARHPRPKLCAGGIMPGGVAWLRGLGLDLGEVDSVDVPEVHFRFEARSFVVRRRPFVFRVVRRAQFDAWLADQARARGLALQEDTPVRRVCRRADGVEVETDRATYRARAVVGADGATGVVRRAVARGHVPHVSRLLEVLVPDDGPPPLSPGLGEGGGGDERRALLDFSCMARGVQGYVWSFPTPVQRRPVRTLGVFDSRVRARAPRAALPAALREAAAPLGVALDRHEVAAHPLRWFHPRVALSAPRVLLVGDAAGVDPLLGEGISFALGYGDVAARALRDAFARGDLSFHDYRSRLLRHPTGRYLRRRTAVARSVYRIHSRRLLRLLWRNFGPLVGWLAERRLVDWGGWA